MRIRTYKNKMKLVQHVVGSVKFLAYYPDRCLATIKQALKGGEDTNGTQYVLHTETMVNGRTDGRTDGRTGGRNFSISWCA
jgi:hypothetical protein